MTEKTITMKERTTILRIMKGTMKKFGMIKIMMNMVNIMITLRIRSTKIFYQDDR